MMDRTAIILVNQRRSIENLINREVEELAEYVNSGSIHANYQLDRLFGILSASFFADIITPEEYNFCCKACLGIVFGKENIE